MHHQSDQFWETLTNLKPPHIFMLPPPSCDKSAPYILTWKMYSEVLEFFHQNIWSRIIGSIWKRQSVVLFALNRRSDSFLCGPASLRVTMTPSAMTGDYFTLVRANYTAQLLQDTLEETSLFTQISHLLNLPPHIHWRPKGRLKSVFTCFFLPSVHLSYYSWSLQTSGLLVLKLHPRCPTSTNSTF